MTSRRNKRLETLESRAVDRKRQERAINLDLPEPGAAESLEAAGKQSRKPSPMSGKRTRNGAGMRFWRT